MKILLLFILLLSACASKPLTVAHGGQWVSVYDDEGMPVASYNPVKEVSVFHADPQDAFRHAMRTNIQLQNSIKQVMAQNQQLAHPAPKATKKKVESKAKPKDDKSADKPKEPPVEKSSDDSGNERL